MFATFGDLCEVAARIVEWDLDTIQQRASDYNRVAQVDKIEWVDACENAEVQARSQPYSCSNTNDEVTERALEGMPTMFFKFGGSVGSASPAYCDNNAKSCSGPSMFTKEFEAAPGETLYFKYKAESGGDWFELMIELWDSVAPVETLAFKRGDSMSDFAEFSHTFTTAGTYKLLFHIGSYDYSGGGVLGALMYVTPFLLIPVTG